MRRDFVLPLYFNLYFFIVLHDVLFFAFPPLSLIVPLNPRSIAQAIAHGNQNYTTSPIARNQA
jgi:hypothetical protein